MPVLEVDPVFLLDAEQIATGVYSPIDGFMNFEMLHSVLDENRLPNDIPWTLPIILQIKDKRELSDFINERVVLTSKEAENIYEIVKESQKVGLKAVRPKKTCASVDAACRKIIEENRCGSYFIHSTGHGIGLDVHENPNISGKNKEKLKKDMVITIEPGIYIPKKFGVRIEDSLIVKDGASVMHKFTKDLIVI